MNLRELTTEPIMYITNPHVHDTPVRILTGKQKRNERRAKDRKKNK